MGRGFARRDGGGGGGTANVGALLRQSGQTDQGLFISSRQATVAWHLRGVERILEEAAEGATARFSSVNDANHLDLNFFDASDTPQLRFTPLVGSSRQDLPEAVNTYNFLYTDYPRPAAEVKASFDYGDLKITSAADGAAGNDDRAQVVIGTPATSNQNAEANVHLWAGSPNVLRGGDIRITSPNASVRASALLRTGSRNNGSLIMRLRWHEAGSVGNGFQLNLQVSRNDGGTEQTVATYAADNRSMNAVITGTAARRNEYQWSELIDAINAARTSAGEQLVVADNAGNTASSINFLFMPADGATESMSESGNAMPDNITLAGGGAGTATGNDTNIGSVEVVTGDPALPLTGASVDVNVAGDGDTPVIVRLTLTGTSRGAAGNNIAVSVFYDADISDTDIFARATADNSGIDIQIRGTAPLGTLLTELARSPIHHSNGSDSDIYVSGSIVQNDGSVTTVTWDSDDVDRSYSFSGGRDAGREPLSAVWDANSHNLVITARPTDTANEVITAITALDEFQAGTTRAAGNVRLVNGAVGGNVIDVVDDTVGGTLQYIFTGGTNGAARTPLRATDPSDTDGDGNLFLITGLISGDTTQDVIDAYSGSDFTLTSVSGDGTTAFSNPSALTATSLGGGSDEHLRQLPTVHVESDAGGSITYRIFYHGADSRTNQRTTLAEMKTAWENIAEVVDGLHGTSIVGTITGSNTARIGTVPSAPTGGEDYVPASGTEALVRPEDEEHGPNIEVRYDAGEDTLGDIATALLAQGVVSVVATYGTDLTASPEAVGFERSMFAGGGESEGTTPSGTTTTSLENLPLPQWASGNDWTARSLLQDVHGRVFRVVNTIVNSTTSPAQDATNFEAVSGYGGEYADNEAYPKGILVSFSDDPYFVNVAVPATNTTPPNTNSSFIRLNAPASGGGDDSGGGPFATEIGRKAFTAAEIPGTSRGYDTGIDIPATVGADEWWGVQFLEMTEDSMHIFKASELTGATNVTIAAVGGQNPTSYDGPKFQIFVTSADYTVSLGRTSDGDITFSTSFRNTSFTPTVVLYRINTGGGGAGGATDLSLGTRTPTTMVIQSSTGDNVTVPVATVTEAGLQSAEHFSLTDDSAVDRVVFWAATTLHADFDVLNFGDTVEFAYGSSTYNATVRAANRSELVCTLILDPIPAATWTAIQAETNVRLNNSDGDQVGGWVNASAETTVAGVDGAGKWYSDKRAPGGGTEVWRELAKIDEEDNTHLSIGARDATTLEIESTTGDDVILPSATGTQAGLQSASDKGNIDALPDEWVAGVWAKGSECSYLKRIYLCLVARALSDTDNPATDTTGWVPLNEARADWNETDTDSPKFVENKPALAPANAEQNVQPNWDESDTNSDAYIQNKPTLAPSNAEQNVQSDWNQTTNTADDFIKNKPTLAPANAEQNVQVDWNVTTTTDDAFIKNKPDTDQSITGATLSPTEVLTLTRRGGTNPIEVNLAGALGQGVVAKAESIGITADVAVSTRSWSKIGVWDTAPTSVYPSSLPAEIITRDDAHTLTLAAGINILHFKGTFTADIDRPVIVFKIQENDGTTVYSISDEHYQRNADNTDGIDENHPFNFSITGVYIASAEREVEVYVGSKPDISGATGNNLAGSALTLLDDDFEFTVIRPGSGNAQINGLFDPQDIGTDTFDLDGTAQQVALTDDTTGSAIVIPETGYIMLIATVPGLGLRGQIDIRLAEDLRSLEADTTLTAGYYTNTDNELIFIAGTQDQAETGNKIIVQRIGTTSESSGGATPDVQPSILDFDVTGARSVVAGNIAGARNYTIEISQSEHIGTARVIGFIGTEHDPTSPTVLVNNAAIIAAGGYHHATGTLTIPATTLAGGQIYTIRLEVYPDGVPDTGAPPIYHDFRITAHAAQASVHFGSMPFFQSDGTTETTDANLDDFTGDISTGTAVNGTWTIADLQESDGERRLYWAVPATAAQPVNWTNAGANVNGIIDRPASSSDTQTIGGVAYLVYVTSTRFDDLANGSSYVVSTS